jgi:hypothetical protein
MATCLDEDAMYLSLTEAPLPRCAACYLGRPEITLSATRTRILYWYTAIRTQDVDGQPLGTFTTESGDRNALGQAPPAVSTGAYSCRVNRQAQRPVLMPLTARALGWDVLCGS